eukprot:scaffold14075_cov58-Phaeocystis_antarctica.AAC.4
MPTSITSPPAVEATSARRVVTRSTMRVAAKACATSGSQTSSSTHSTPRPHRASALAGHELQSARRAGCCGGRQQPGEGGRAASWRHGGQSAARECPRGSARARAPRTTRQLPAASCQRRPCHAGPGPLSCHQVANLTVASHASSHGTRRRHAQRHSGLQGGTVVQENWDPCGHARVNVGRLDHSLPIGPALVDDERIIRVDELKFLDPCAEAIVQMTWLCDGQHRLARGALRLLRSLATRHCECKRLSKEFSGFIVQLGLPARDGLDKSHPAQSNPQL